MTPSGILVTILLLISCFVKSSIEIPNNRTYRIVLGTKIDIRKVPWQISLHQELDDKKLHFKCGGVIIGKNQVLTTASCFHGQGDKYYIRAGVANRNEGGPTPGVNDYYVQKVVKHPEYHFDSCRVDRDLAFVKLAKPLKFGKNIKAIKLSKFEPKNGKKVTVAGWGKTNPKWETKPSFPEHLHSITISVWDKKSCYDNFKIPHILKAKDDVKCLSNQKTGGLESVCHGDNGSPVVWKSKKLVGLVTAIMSNQVTLPPDRPCGPMTLEEVSQMVCNDKKSVGVYNSVVPHREWIKKMMRENS